MNEINRDMIIGLLLIIVGALGMWKVIEIGILLYQYGEAHIQWIP